MFRNLQVRLEEAFDRIQAVLPKVSEEANAERIVQLPNLGFNHKNPKAEAERLQRIGVRYARNGAWRVTLRLSSGNASLPKSVIWRGEFFSTIITGRRIKTVQLLANIITGPATVAQWINLQYYASTVAPHYYGSGNKTTQTVTAGIGVMQGNASDLLSGLPWQSVMQSDQEAYHAPLRLLVVIQAPRKYVKRMLDHDSGISSKSEKWMDSACVH